MKALGDAVGDGLLAADLSYATVTLGVVPQ